MKAAKPSNPALGLVVYLSPEQLLRLQTEAALTQATPAQVAARALEDYTTRDRGMASLAEAAMALAVNPATLARAVRRGEVPHVRIGRALRFHLPTLIQGAIK